MFDRHAERLEDLKPRVLVGQFAGAAGTLASLGDKGFAVQEALCAELKLGEFYVPQPRRQNPPAEPVEAAIAPVE
jgi:adenylosuccinate lyase